jgi:hypothetical protein
MVSPDHLDAETDDIGGDILTEADLCGGAEGEPMDPGLLAALTRDLERGEQAAAVLAEAEMRRVIEFNQQVGDHRFIDGLGQLRARLPMSVYLAWIAREGPEFFKDAGNLDFLAKRAGGGRGNPGLLIETKGRATMIVDRTFNSPARGVAPVLSDEVEKPAGAAQSVPAVPRRAKRGRWAL